MITLQPTCQACGSTTKTYNTYDEETHIHIVGGGCQACGQKWSKDVAVLVDSRKDDIRRHVYFVEKLTGEFHFATLEDTDEVYTYDGGVYRPGGEAVIRRRVEEAYRDTGESAKHTFVAEVIDGIRRRTLTPREAFNPPGLLSILNGILDLKTGTVSPHAPEQKFTVQIPVAHDPGAACPDFLKFLGEVLPDATVRKFIQMFFGHCLEPGNPYQFAVMFHGPGNDGKTTLLNVLIGLLGKENVSTETLQTLSDNRFAAANLWSKLANVCGDIPSSPMRYTSVFKMATGGDLMRGERKNRNAFSFVNAAKLVFSANELPEVNDRTYAFWRRWRLIPFEQDFTGTEDRELSDKLLAELPGILNWTLEGLSILHDEGDFPRTTTTEALKEKWKERADSLYWFVSEIIEEESKGWVSKDDFYQAYAEFCDANGVAAKSREFVGGDLPTLMPTVRAERRRVGPEGKDGSKALVRGWAGIVVKWGMDTRTKSGGETGESSETGPSYIAKLAGL